MCPVPPMQRRPCEHHSEQINPEMVEICCEPNEIFKRDNFNVYNVRLEKAFECLFFWCKLPWINYWSTRNLNVFLLTPTNTYRLIVPVSVWPVQVECPGFNAELWEPTFWVPYMNIIHIGAKYRKCRINKYSSHKIYDDRNLFRSLHLIDV